MKPALRVLAPGLLTTVQDLGRTGYQSLGVPVSGAMDIVSFAAANAIVGNPPSAAALEIAYQGPSLVVEATSVRIAYAGPETAIDILSPDGTPRRLPRLQSARLMQGETLRIGALTGSAVGYLAVEGGIDVPLMLGSRSTLTRATIGGFEGRQLRAQDRLPLATADAPEREEASLPSLDLSPPERFRVVLGPQDDYFTARGIETLLTATYTVTQSSDRMGMRLDGPKLEHADGFDIVSDGIAPGTIQVPGNGMPIVLLADRQTTGGYPKIATVISADLAPLGRLRPGAQVRFEKVSVGEAQGIRREQARMIASLRERLVPVPPTVSINLEKLYGSNLLSGWVDARE
ncbi:MAG: biotin-dependent carboxyltransferase [Hyphomicrobiales bacterium]|nr:MAG: biotin-dependent carboxyltransferase [Hyphomicrobiales bacterium]